jgi:hypothetical protein
MRQPVENFFAFGRGKLRTLYLFIFRRFAVP